VRRVDSTDRVVAWRPELDGVAEVLHARWHEHSYPLHTHDTWTLLVVDDGVIAYDLDRAEHAAYGSLVTLLPPHVVHDGKSATARGFAKRVLYLEKSVLGERLIGRAVDSPTLDDPALRRWVSSLDRALAANDELPAETLLALVTERLRWHLSGCANEAPSMVEHHGVARSAREILDADPVGVPTIGSVAAMLGVSTAHLVRAFTHEFGIPPHRYLIGRRLDLARHRLLAGEPPAHVATTTGFYDQAHLTRHFRCLLRTTPARYQRGPAT
jgi:AraC-like DNA-binding protein